MKVHMGTQSRPRDLYFNISKYIKKEKCKTDTLMLTAERSAVSIKVSFKSRIFQTPLCERKDIITV